MCCQFLAIAYLRSQLVSEASQCRDQDRWREGPSWPCRDRSFWVAGRSQRHCRCPSAVGLLIYTSRRTSPSRIRLSTTLRVTAHGAWAAVATAIATVVSCSCRAAAHQKQGGGGLPTRWSSSSRSGRAHRDQGRDRSAAGAPHGICSLRMLLVRAREELHSSIGMAVLASSDGSAALPHPTSEYVTDRTI